MNMCKTITAALALALCLLMPAAAQDATEAVDASAQAETAEAVEVAESADAAATSEASEMVEAAAEATTGTGKIVFFRPKKLTGAAIVYKVREGDTVLGKLSSGSFFVAEVPAGTHEYYVKSEGKDDTLVLEVEAGETYYVSASISMGFLAGQGNLSPSDEAAFNEAKKKKLKDRTGEKVD